MLALRPDRILAWLFPVVLVFSLWAVSVGWSHNLLDAHGFRQTQTAMAARYLAQGGPFLAYHVPVFGPPWALPFEFPLYQGLVAVLNTRFGVGLESAGRFVSVAFFYLGLLPAWFILGSLGIAARQRLIGLAFVLVSPLYLFWSRAFMMESTAVFFSLLYLALVIRSWRAPGIAICLAVVLCGSLAGMVKITTLYGFWCAAVALGIRALWRDRRVNPTIVAVAVCAYVLPLATSVAWTRFADHQRALNPLGTPFTVSDIGWWRWQFGTLGQRLDAATWSALLGRNVINLCGSPAFFVTLASIVWSKRHRAAYFVCLALYIVAALTFTNLYVVHDYYAYGGGLFVLAAQALAVCALLEGDSRQRLAGVTIAFLFVALPVWGYFSGYYQLQKRENDGLPAFARQVEAMSHPDDVLVLYGLDWSPELPYYANRRAIMIRNPFEMTRDRVAEVKSRIAALGLHAGPLLICGLPERFQPPYVERWDLDPSRGVPLEGCRVYR